MGAGERDDLKKGRVQIGNKSKRPKGGGVGGRHERQGLNEMNNNDWGQRCEGGRMRRDHISTSYFVLNYRSR